MLLASGTVLFSDKYCSFPATQPGQPHTVITALSAFHHPSSSLGFAPEYRAAHKHLPTAALETVALASPRAFQLSGKKCWAGSSTAFTFYLQDKAHFQVASPPSCPTLRIWKAEEELGVSLGELRWLSLPCPGRQLHFSVNQVQGW